MALTTLKDDLLAEFREERIMINEQIEMLDPLSISLRKPAAQRLFSSGTLILAELSCYIVSAGGIAFMAFMHLIYPFSILSQIFYDSDSRNKVGGPGVFYLILGMYALAAAGVMLIFIVGRMAREMRLKNEILHVVGKDIRTLIGQHLERKAALDTIEQRHQLATPEIGQPVILSQPVKMPQPVRIPVNEVMNPAYSR